MYISIDSRVNVAAMPSWVPPCRRGREEARVGERKRERERGLGCVRKTQLSFSCLAFSLRDTHHYNTCGVSPRTGPPSEPTGRAPLYGLLTLGLTKLSSSIRGVVGAWLAARQGDVVSADRGEEGREGRKGWQAWSDKVTRGPPGVAVLPPLLLPISQALRRGP